MKNVLVALAVVAVAVLAIGAASHGARADVNYLAGTWHGASALALSAAVAALIVIVGLGAALIALLGAARDRDVLETELQSTYARLRAAESANAAQRGAAAGDAPPAVSGDAPSAAAGDDAPDTRCDEPGGS